MIRAYWKRRQERRNERPLEARVSVSFARESWVWEMSLEVPWSERHIWRSSNPWSKTAPTYPTAAAAERAGVAEAHRAMNIERHKYEMNKQARKVIVSEIRAASR